MIHITNSDVHCNIINTSAHAIRLTHEQTPHCGLPILQLAKALLVSVTVTPCKPDTGFPLPPTHLNIKTPMTLRQAYPT